MGVGRQSVHIDVFKKHQFVDKLKHVAFWQRGRKEDSNQDKEGESNGPTVESIVKERKIWSLS